MQRVLSTIKEGGAVRPFDAVFNRKNGSRVEVSLSISPIRSSEGIVVGSSAIARDISQRNRLKRKLQESERSYRDILDGAVEGVFQSSFEGSVLAANPAMAKMLGYDSAAEVLAGIKDSAHDVWVYPEMRSRFVKQVLDQGIVRGFECQFKSRNATIIWVSLSCRRVDAVNGRPPYLEGFIEDITERRLAVEALRESEETLRESQIMAGLGSYVMDLRTGLWKSSGVLDDLFGAGSSRRSCVHGRLFRGRSCRQATSIQSGVQDCQADRPISALGTWHRPP